MKKPFFAMTTQIDAYFFIVFVGLFATVDGWVNSYDGPFTFECPQHEYISYIASIHDNNKEDRVWDFRCSSLSTLNVSQEYFNTETCSWSEYVNNFDEPVVHQCPSKHFLAGFSSYHDNHYEDRRWKFYCCEIQGLHLEDCNYSGYVNSLDHPMAYTVPAGKILKGAVSINYNHEDAHFLSGITLVSHTPQSRPQIVSYTYQPDGSWSSVRPYTRDRVWEYEECNVVEF